MKKVIVTALALSGAVTAYSQGTISFYAYGTGLKQAIFGAQAGNTQVTYDGYTVSEQMGSASAAVIPKESPVGNTVYSAAPLGGSTATGSLYDAQLLAAVDTTAGQVQPLSALAPVGTPENFYTQAAAAGFVKGAETITFASGTTASVAIAAWAINASGPGGAANTLAQAQADLAQYGNDSGYAWGISLVADDGPFGTGANPPAVMPTTITSFSLGQSVPEPSTVALGVMGASALLFRRRK